MKLTLSEQMLSIKNDIFEMAMPTPYGVVGQAE